MGFLYKELLSMAKDDLENWDWSKPYPLEEDIGKALLELLEKRDRRCEYLRKNYQKNPEAKREYQREWCRKNRPRKRETV